MQGYMEVVEHFKENVHNFAIDVPIGTTTGGGGSQESEVPDQYRQKYRSTCDTLT